MRSGMRYDTCAWEAPWAEGPVRVRFRARSSRGRENVTGGLIPEAQGARDADGSLAPRGAGAATPVRRFITGRNAPQRT